MKKLRKRAFDEAWKRVLKPYFWEFLDFYFPHISEEIDKKKTYVFLDKELEKIVRASTSKSRRVDKLVKIYLKDQQEVWLLIHVEVQTYKDIEFAQRMYSYHYRIYDRYQKPVSSLAILADNNKNFRPRGFKLSAFGKVYVNFEFETCKILDWKGKEKELENMKNPFATVTLASLKAYERKQTERYEWKRILTRLLYEKGYEKQTILDLYHFIDSIMVLEDEQEIKYHEEIVKYEEGKKMVYITTAERIGMQKGIKEGMQKGIRLALKIKYGKEGLKAMDIIEKFKTLDTLGKVEELLEEPLSFEEFLQEMERF